MMSHDFRKLSRGDAYRLLIDMIVPRPIAFVSTQNRLGATNVAPFSFFSGVSSDPPVLSISCGPKKDGTPKDTLRNITETAEFVVNIMGHAHLTQLHQASAEYPYGVSEFDRIGLTPQASTEVKPPRVAEAAIQIECQLREIVEVGSTRLVLGNLLVAHVSPAVLRGDRIDVLALDPIARLGGRLYGKTREIIELDPAVDTRTSG